MLNTVPKATARAARMVTLRHPNAIDCTVWRKVLSRPSEGESVGGAPSIGGMGMLDAEDEAAYEYEVVGDAKILMGGIWEDQASNWNDADTGVIYDKAPREAMIEMIDESKGYVQKPDRLTLEPGGGITLVYEVVSEGSSVAIPPYTRSYMIAARSDSEVGIG